MPTPLWHTHARRLTSGGHKRAEDEGLLQGPRVHHANGAAAVGDQAHHNGGKERAEKSKHTDRAKIREEGALVHAVAALKDDRRQQHHEEHGREAVIQHGHDAVQLRIVRDAQYDGDRQACTRATSYGDGMAILARVHRVPHQ